MPPKPWERQQTAGATTASSALTRPFPAAEPEPEPVTQAAPGLSSTPSVPDRSALTSSLNKVGSRYGSNYGSGYGGAYGSGLGGYGSYGGMSTYNSPYSRLGGMGSYGSMGMGGMGGMGGYGGYGGYGGMGMPNDPNEPNSLTRGMEHSTQATFQMIESIVGAFGNFAQMLESTFMATHSSFFAMVSVAEQFGNLKNTLGSLLGIFAIIRWARIVLAKLTGRPLPPSSGARDLTPANFEHFQARGPRSSKKPLLFFVLAVFGLPFLMGRLVRAIASRQDSGEQRRLAGGGVVDADGRPIDPSKLDFCRALYDFTPQDPAIELRLRTNDVVAILSQTDPAGNESQWWRGRLRDGQMGYFPSNFVAIIPRREGQQGSKQAVEKPLSNTYVEEFQKKG